MIEYASSYPNEEFFHLGIIYLQNFCLLDCKAIPDVLAVGYSITNHISFTALCYRLLKNYGSFYLDSALFIQNAILKIAFS